MDVSPSFGAGTGSGNAASDGCVTFHGERSMQKLRTLTDAGNVDQAFNDCRNADQTRISQGRLG